MKNFLILVFSILLIYVKAAPLMDSSFPNSLEPKGSLDPQTTLTLTIVTGSLTNTHLVSDYYSSMSQITIYDRTKMHLKMKATVAQLSLVFNTTFVEYNCHVINLTHKLCFANTSDISIPVSLKNAIVGILGLEQIVSCKPSFVIGQKLSTFSSNAQSVSSFSYFLGSQVATDYGVPASTGAGINVGIISFGGYFTQSDLNTYFSNKGLGTAPTINIVFIDGGTLNFTDTNSALENYLDIEIIASVVPQATITVYFAPNGYTSFYYDNLYAAITQNNIVSSSWSFMESQLISRLTGFLNSVQKLLSIYSNVPVFVATGDHGSTGGVGFPASAPNSIGKYFHSQLSFYIFKYF